MKKILLALILFGGVHAFGQSTQRTPAALSAACSNATTTCNGTANSQLLVGVGEYALGTVTVSGTFTGATIFFEFSDDGGITWFPNTCTRADISTQELSEALTNSTARAWDCGLAASGMFRVRLSAISTGTVNAAVTMSIAQIEPAATVAISNSTAPNSNPVSVVPNTGTYTDRSGSVATGGTSQTLMAANTSRKRIIIQNPCSTTTQGIGATENLFINFTSAASTSAGSSIELQPCGSYDSSTGPVTTELITVNAATSAHKYAAKEM